MANVGAGTYEVDPISRIEGHLGVKVTTNASGIITGADAHGNLWRGFENFLLGREINDAITFTQRICGVCPVPHGLTATYAADTVLGYSQGHITFADDGTWGIPKKAVHMRNLVLSAEFLMSSLTHFYHLVAPSYIQGPAMPPWTPYFADSYYNAALVNSGSKLVPTNTGTFSDTLWDTVIRSYVKALRIRRLTFEAGALFAGRMPMTSCFVGGGVTFDGTENLDTQCDKYESIMQEVGEFIVKEYVPIALALGVLYPAFDNDQDGAGTAGIGGGLGQFLAWGAFPDPDTGALTLPGGVSGLGAGDFTVVNKGEVASKFLAGGSNAVPDNLTEDITYSRYDNSVQGNVDVEYPGAVTRTMPDRAKAGAYTYMRAPRWDGNAMEVGPFARLVVAGYYPVNGDLLATTVPGYLGYVRAFDPSVVVQPAGSLEYPASSGTYYGLDPRMIEADIAVALVRDGLADVYLPDGTGPVVDEATIVANYSGAIILGTIGAVMTLEGGLSTIDRLRARALESLVLVQKMIGTFDKVTGWDNTGSWIARLKALGVATAGVYDASKSTWKNKSIPTGTAQGWGGTEAPRGALMHQTTITAGKITAYQCIVPTTWNGSPKDAGLNPGAMEAAVIGAPFDAAGAQFTSAVTGGATITTMGGVEVLRIAQSFDPCIACAVH